MAEAVECAQHWHCCHASQPEGPNCTRPIIRLHHWGHRWMRTQCTIYLFSGDFQVQMRSLITSRLEKLRQKCSANNCRLKSSRQKNFCVGHRGSSPKIIFSRQMRQAARWSELLFCVLKHFVFRDTNSLMKKCLPTGNLHSFPGSRRSHCHYVTHYSSFTQVRVSQLYPSANCLSVHLLFSNEAFFCSTS